MTTETTNKLNRIRSQQEKLNSFASAIEVIEWLAQNHMLKDEVCDEGEVLEMAQLFAYGHVTDDDIVSEMRQIDQILTPNSEEKAKSEFVVSCSYVATTDYSNKLRFVTCLSKTKKTLTFSVDGVERRVKLQTFENCEIAEFDGLTVKAKNKKREIKNG